MRTSPIRLNEKGIFVITNGAHYRPGPVSGYSHVHDMSDGGLKVGDRVIVRKIAQTPLASIVTMDARKLVWHVAEPTQEMRKHLKKK